ncbi:MAG: phage protein Gp37 [Thermodesulfobacteriota bacterium]
MITQLLDATMALISAGLPYLRKVEDLPSRQVLKDSLAGLAVNAPCVYAIYEGGTFREPASTAPRQYGQPGIVLATIAKSVRDPYGRAASRGDGVSKGAYEILTDLHQSLLGQIPAEGFGRLYLVNEGLFAVKDGVVVYVSTYRANYQLQP